MARAPEPPFRDRVAPQRHSVQWDWDPAKDRENFRKHGISFAEATLVFEDTNNLIVEDPYRYEQRWRTIGSVGPAIIIVIHTWEPARDGSFYGRIISARIANSHERAQYEEG